MWPLACQDAVGKGDEEHCLLFLETQPSLHHRCQRRAGVGRPKQVVIKNSRASLVAQWLRVCLPMQGTRVRALVWEDPTCRGATRPVSHNY